MPLIYTVPQSHCVLIQRFGKFARIQNAGLHFKIPFIEEVHRYDTPGSNWEARGNKGGWLMELTEQQTNTQPRRCHTKDNVEVTADASVYWRIVDPRRAVYEVDNLPASIADVALNALRAQIGTLELAAGLAERHRLSQGITTKLALTAEKWGVQYTRVELQEVTTSEDITRAMMQQMAAERGKRAKVAEAEGEATATVKMAEAERNATILKAQGEAQATALRAEAEATYLARLQQVTTSENAAHILISQKYIEGFNSISNNKSDKVYLPSSFRGLLALDEQATHSS